MSFHRVPNDHFSQLGSLSQSGLDNVNRSVTQKWLEQMWIKVIMDNSVPSLGCISVRIKFSRNSWYLVHRKTQVFICILIRASQLVIGHILDKVINKV